MKANISDELERLIDEKIYLDLELHILNNKLLQATNNGKNQNIILLKDLISKKLSEIKKINDSLRKENVKILEPSSDDLFVQYDFYIKTNGGYKEGSLRYWKDAMKYKLNNRLNNRK